MDDNPSSSVMVSQADEENVAFPVARRSSQGNVGWRQKMQAADGAIGLCKIIHGARSTDLSNSRRGGKGGEESMNFLNSLNPEDRKSFLVRPIRCLG